MNIEKMINEDAATIVDVRTVAEFMGGHVAGSVNIPLGELAERTDEIKSLKGPIVLCCASGMRSGQAQRFLSQMGIECYNGGGWMDVNYLKGKLA